MAEDGHLTAAMKLSSVETDLDVGAMPPLDGEGPLWLQIRRSLSLPIISGQWPSGTRIPPEMLLTDHYNTSRMTVNKAIQSLATEGLVQRRPKIGTIVTETARERPIFEIWDAADMVHQAGGHYSYKLLDCEAVAPGSELRKLFPVGPDTPLMNIQCLHLSDGRPFQFEERVINVDAAPRISSHILQTVSPGQWLLAHVPYTQARHNISARGASEAVGRHLGLNPGSACLVMERRTWNAAVPVTIGRFWYPGDDHSLDGSFKPSW